MSASLQAWALPRLEQLLPLDEESLKQIITYTDTLPKEHAAEHLKEILGDSAKSLEFISSFNQRRQRPPNEAVSQPATQSTQAQSEVPRARHKNVKKKNIHALPARQVEDHGNTSGAYRKNDEQDYIPKQARQKHKEQLADNLALRQDKPDATQLPLITGDASLTTKPITSKPPPSAAGQLVSDTLAPKKTASRTSSPAPKAKVNIAGGTAMHGASTALSDLDSAIKALEIQTNPSLSSADDAKRQCNCMATRHPLLDIAPNCLNCGKIICVKQGLGPCTFCHTPLMSSDDLSKILRVLKDERGEERMRVNNASHKKADVSVGKARAFTGREFLAQAGSSARSSPLSSAPASDAEEDDATSKAKAHRDKLLNFQANNARRTQIHDEAADYDTPSSGTNMWASPQERAQQLKKQQRVLREMEWNARPEYEKRQVVASIDIKGGKVVRRMAEVEKPNFDDEQDEVDEVAPAVSGDGGAFSNNPLLGTMIKPVARASKGKDPARGKKSTWRRVQMDEDDNEQWILDGGMYGGQVDDRVLGSEEPACG